MQRKISQKTAVEVFLGILLLFAIVAACIAAWAGAQTEEPDLYEGFVTFDEGVRYYDAGVYRTDWQEIGGNRYYFYLESGYMATGIVRIGGEWFVFGEDGVQVRTGFVSVGAGTLYFRDGHALTGWQVIDGAQYYFFLETGYMATGTVSIGGEEYTFSKDGKLLSIK